MKKQNKKIQIILIFIILGLLVYYSVWSAEKALQIHGPSRMVHGPDNSIYVIVDGSITRISANGEVLANIDIKKEYSFPDPVADFFVEPNGEIIVGVASSQEIVKLSPEGKLLHTYPFQPFTPPKDYLPYFRFTKDPSTGNFYLSDSHRNTIRCFDSDNREIATLKAPKGVENSLRNKYGSSDDPSLISFHWPNRIDFYQDYLFLVDTNNERVLRLLPDGTLTKAFFPAGKERTTLNRPTDLSVNGNILYVISRTPNGEDGEIVAIDMENDKRWQLDIETAVASEDLGKNTGFLAEDIFARDNDVLVSDQNLMKVFKFSKEGKYIGLFGQKSFHNLLLKTQAKKLFFQWGKTLSILCMGILLLILWHENRKKKKEHLNSKPRVQRDVPLYQRELSKRTYIPILLALICGIFVLAWRAGALPSVDLRSLWIEFLIFAMPFLYIFFMFSPLVVVFSVIYYIFKKLKGTKRLWFIIPVAIVCILAVTFVGTMTMPMIHFLPNVIKRPLLNSLLFLDMGRHDLYITISKIGDRGSVPFMIKALKKEQQGPLAEHNREIILSGLRHITSNDFGNRCGEWETWWKKNKDKTDEEWKLGGLQQAGYAVSGYPAQSAISSIIDAMAYAEPVPSGREYLLRSAATLLLKLPTENVIEAINTKLRESEAVNTKVGAARALGTVGNEAAVSYLRALIIDKNEIVRNTALFELNELQRRLIKSLDRKNLKSEISTGDYVHYIAISPDEESLYYASRFVLTKVNLTSGKPIWSYKSHSEIGSELVAREREVLFYGYDGTVNCIDSTTGTLVWKYQTEGTTYRYHSKIIAVGDTAYIGVEDYVRALDIENGRIKWAIKILPSSGLITHSSEHIFIATRHGELLKVTPAGRVLMKADIGGWPYSLESYDNLLYVTYKAEPAYLKAFSSKKLELQVRWQIGQSFSTSPVAVSERIILIPNNYYLTAYDRKKGRQLWSVEEKEYAHISLSENFIAVGDELRDQITGELLHKYNIPRIQQACLFRKLYIISDYDGKLFLLNIPESISNHGKIITAMN